VTGFTIAVAGALALARFGEAPGDATESAAAAAPGAPRGAEG
jgi:hypothetical protein